LPSRGKGKKPVVNLECGPQSTRAGGFPTKRKKTYPTKNAGRFLGMVDLEGGGTFERLREKRLARRDAGPP